MESNPIEAAIAVAPNDCNIGIHYGLNAVAIAKFLNKHNNEFTTTPVGKYGVLIHRKSCDAGVDITGKTGTPTGQDR